jgi:hypothetical protein
MSKRLNQIFFNRNNVKVIYIASCIFYIVGLQRFYSLVH